MPVATPVPCPVTGLADAFEGHDPLGHAAVEQTVFGRFCGQLADGRQPQIDGSRSQAGRFQKGPGSTDSRRLREDESVEKYADRKELVITNTARQVYPNSKRRRTTVANGNDITKGDLQECIDEATQILEAAYVPDADRETLATAIGNALAALGGDTDDDEDDSDDDDSDDEDDPGDDDADDEDVISEESIALP